MHSDSSINIKIAIFAIILAQAATCLREHSFTNLGIAFIVTGMIFYFFIKSPEEWRRVFFFRLSIAILGLSIGMLIVDMLSPNNTMMFVLVFIAYIIAIGILAIKAKSFK